jgi:hypothetical protein
VISAATSASIAGQRRLRLASDEDGLDVEVIFWPLLIGYIVSVRGIRVGETPASRSTVAQRFCVQIVSQAVIGPFRGA